MSYNIALIPSTRYTFESGWESDLDSMAGEIETNWNDRISNSSSEEISVSTPDVSEYSNTYSGGIDTPLSSQPPEEFRNQLQTSLELSTTFFDSFATVLVRTVTDQENVGGIAYLGDANSDGNQAAGSKHGVGVIFDSSENDVDLSIIGFHELMHTFSARHQDGTRRPPGIISPAEKTVMCGYVNSGCNNEYNTFPNRWETTDCTSSSVSEYINAWEI